MATDTNIRPLNGDSHMEDDGDPPQLPIIVPNSITSVPTSEPLKKSGNDQVAITSEPLNGEIPAVVSITRVPAKAKMPEVVSGGGLKVRTDLGAPPGRPGPPPLLRVSGGQAPRPALPPMPRLKLGGQRTTAPAQMRFQAPIRVPQTPLNGMISMVQTSQAQGLLTQKPVDTRPISTNSLTLRYVHIINFLTILTIKLTQKFTKNLSTHSFLF